MEETEAKKGRFREMQSSKFGMKKSKLMKFIFCLGLETSLGKTSKLLGYNCASRLREQLT